jgi:uncharacterized OsmC-like protein
MKTTPTAYEVEAEIVRPGVSMARSKRATIEFDSAPTQGDELPGPADLLTIAFAACVLKNVERFSRILPFSYEAASIRVSAERQDVPPKMTRITYELSLVTPESAHKVELLHQNIRQHGTIYSTLAATCAVSGTISAHAPAAPAVVAQI